MKGEKSLKSGILIKPEIAGQFQTVMEQGRILFFSAPCGFGKTCVATALLKGRRVLQCSAEEDDLTAIAADASWDILLVDQLHMLQDIEGQQALCTLIREHPEKRFVLLSRGIVPGWLIAFQLAGIMQTIDAHALFFDRETTAAAFAAYGVMLSESDLTTIFRETQGYPLAVIIIAQRMANGAAYDPETQEAVLHEIYLYFEEAIYRRFDLPMRRFLLDLAPFEEFSADLAKVVSGNVKAGEMLAHVRQNSTMFLRVGLNKFSFWPIFRDFLLWEQAHEYTNEQQCGLYSRAGLYYELREDYGRSLECYSRSGEYNKVSELLIKNAELHPGMGHYKEMERYYLSLPEEKIAASPALMQGVSMLCSLRMDYKESERWYQELERFAAVRKKTDAAVREARSRLAWLDISLPQRGVSHMTETISAAFRLMMNREIKLSPFSVTSTLPSLMNGGKDFSDWSKKDDLLYATMRIPVEAVLGKDGVGMADCAIAESKFEKGEDVSSRMLTLVSKISDVQSRGTPDIEFALVGLLARHQVACGRAEDAAHTVEALRNRFAENEQSRFFANIDALLCRIALRTGDMEYAENWYRQKAPKDLINLQVMKRYQYFTQAMMELALGDEDAALLTLAPLVPYCAECERHIDTIHLKLLTAEIKRRKGNEEWKAEMRTAIDIASEYHFIRTISMYGALALPLLTECDWCGDAAFMKQLLKATRGQAVYYPNFMKPRRGMSEKLTEAETQVLRLLCADKSNAEIGEILDIRLATVKSHVSHILQKLGVSRRSEAKTAAQKLRLI